MKGKYMGILALVLIAVVVVAGCMGGEPEDEDEEEEYDEDEVCPTSCEDNNICTRDYCSAATGYQCAHDPITPCCGNGVCESGEDFTSCSVDCLSTACTSNEDCDDGNRCTSDACLDGNCVNTAEANCEIEEELEPYIMEVHTASPEYAILYGKNWDIGKWTLSDDDGNVFEFVLHTKINGEMKIYSGYGLSTSNERYWGKGDDAVWDAGDVVTLKDESGRTIDTTTA